MIGGTIPGQVDAPTHDPGRIREQVEQASKQCSLMGSASIPASRFLPGIPALAHIHAGQQFSAEINPFLCSYFGHSDLSRQWKP